MEGFFLGISLALCFLVLLSLYRAAFGPTVLDRIISVSVIGTKTTVILLLIGFIYKRADMFVDISLAYALLNFIATIAAAKFFHTRKSIIPGSKYYATTQSFPLVGNPSYKQGKDSEQVGMTTQGIQNNNSKEVE